MASQRITVALLFVFGALLALPHCAGQSITYCAPPPASGTVIQGCIDSTPVGGQLQLQPGTYNIDIQLLINKPMLLTTYGRANTGPACFDGSNANVDWTCAVLLASPNLATTGGMLRLRGPNITLDHIVVHGNHDQRVNALRGTCETDNTIGMNIRCDVDSPAAACDNVTFRNGVSTSAVCGSGFALYGNNPNVNNSMFSYNGNGNAGPRADGLSLTPCKDGQSDSTCPASGIIYNNYFFSNTDIDLIAFAGPGLKIQNNHFQHNANADSSGLGVIMLDNSNRNDSARGNFIGADVSGNIINCNGFCDFGLVLGDHPWYILQPSYPPCTTTGATRPYVCENTETVVNIYGGSVHDNQVSGAKQGIVADGAGRAHWMNSTCNDTTLNCAVRIWNNTVQGTFGQQVNFFCGGHTPVPFTTSPLNVRSGNLGETTVVCWGPNCVSSEVPPPGTTFNPWHGCW